jgi:hypothetical protein
MVEHGRGCLARRMRLVRRLGAAVMARVCALDTLSALG